MPVVPDEVHVVLSVLDVKPEHVNRDILVAPARPEHRRSWCSSSGTGGSRVPRAQGVQAYRSVGFTG